MSRAKRSVRTTYGTLEQLHAHRRLAFAIDQALEDGLRVPCVENPTAWDTVDPHTWAADGPCTGCPVIDLCDTYRETGAVTHGILANHIIRDPRDELRAQRRRAA